MPPYDREATNHDGQFGEYSVGNEIEGAREERPEKSGGVRTHQIVQWHPPTQGTLRQKQDLEILGRKEEKHLSDIIPLGRARRLLDQLTRDPHYKENWFAYGLRNSRGGERLTGKAFSVAAATDESFRCSRTPDQLYRTSTICGWLV